MDCQSTVQARAEGGQAADRPLVEPVEPHRGRGPRRRPGFDWLLLDTEHSPNDLPMVYSQLQAAAAARRTRSCARRGTTWSRSSASSTSARSRLLIPFVQNAEEARQRGRRHALSARGVRGVASALARDAVRPREGLRAARARGNLRAGAGRDPQALGNLEAIAGGRRASTACSSGPATCRPTWVSSASRDIRRCPPPSTTRSRRIRACGKRGRRPDRRRNSRAAFHREGLRLHRCRLRRGAAGPVF